MCVIVYKPIGQSVSLDILDKCQTTNPDMFGVSYLLDGIIHTYRGQKSVKSVLKRIKLELGDIEIDSLPFIWHFRIATSGQVNTENCHPFQLNRDFIQYQLDKKHVVGRSPVLFHNGVLSGMGNKSYSDTCELSWILTKLTHNEKVSVLTNLVSGYGNKFAIMHTKGVRTFGTFHLLGGVYYSNLTWNITTVVANTTQDYTQVWSNGEYKSLSEYGTSAYVCAMCGQWMTYKERVNPLERDAHGNPYCDKCASVTIISK